jgi:hypothetical protein
MMLSWRPSPVFQRPPSGSPAPVELDLPESVKSRPRKTRRRSRVCRRPPKGRRGRVRVRRSAIGTRVVTGTSHTPRRPRVSGRTMVASTLPNPMLIDSARTYRPASPMGKTDVPDLVTMVQRDVTHFASTRVGFCRGLSRREISFYKKICC